MTPTKMDHKELLASLPDDVRLELTGKSDLAGILKLSSHVFAIVTTGIWIAFAFPYWQVASVLHGIQLVFLFTLLHETLHDTPFKSQWLNIWVGRICGLVLVLPPLWFRYFHLAHHRHTHDPKRDPELAGKPIKTPIQYAWKVTGLPSLWFNLVTLLKNTGGGTQYDYVPGKARSRIKNEARLLLCIYAGFLVASLFFQSSILLHLWIIPMLLGQPFLRLYLMAEHGRCAHVSNMLENTRTTFTNRFVRWLAWNMPYHAEHHAFPAVPFHKLPRFHEVAKRHLQVTENGYMAFNKQHFIALSGRNSGERKV
ncbi:MAG: fatty acid desaturase [Pseudomonadota bacterium]